MHWDAILRSKAKRWIRMGVLFGLLTVLAFIAIEGAASMFIFGYNLLFTTRSLQRTGRAKYQQLDSLLGWINIPNLHLPDLYGPGIGLRTNSRSFRSSHEFEASVPEGKVRVLCSGDSFTFGIGVANDETFCALLEVIDPRLETVNLGEAGYGVGQMYLKYVREGAQLAHDIHIVAPISDDFRRMTLPRFVGYDKPRVTVEDGELVTANVPIGRQWRIRPWLVYNSHLYEGLRSYQFGTLALNRLTGRLSREVALPERTRETAWRILEELHELAEARGATLVIALLPSNLLGKIRGEEWRELMEDFAAERGVIFVDVYSRFRSIRVAARRGMFTRSWSHYSVEGNRFVAEAIYDAMRRHAPLDTILGG